METLTNPRHLSAFEVLPGMPNPHAACEGVNPRVLYGVVTGCNPVPSTSYCPQHHPAAYAARAARHRGGAR